MIRYLSQEEKIKTRNMYETNFPEDAGAFVDYYYTNKTKDNKILVMEEEKLLVMLHLNPYKFRICGEEMKVNYIVAVATDASVRRQGRMAEVMKRALLDMAEANQPFTFLIPANPRVYESSGFAFVPSEKYQQYEKAEACADIVLRQAAQEDISKVATFANTLLEREYDIFPYHTKEYYERMTEELASQNGAIVLLEHPGKPEAERNGDGEAELIGCFSYGRDEAHAELQEILVKQEYRAGFFKLAEQWLAEEDASGEAVKRQEMEEMPLGITDMDFMVRITNLMVLGLMLRSEEPFSLRVCVKDELIPSNAGCYEIRADREGSSIRVIAEEETECAMEIGELTGFLFGRMKLFIREWV